MRGSISAKIITFILNLQKLSCPLMMIVGTCVKERGKPHLVAWMRARCARFYLMLELVTHGFGGQAFSGRRKVLAATRG